MVLVHSHRHNKDDPFINNLEKKVDFSLVRDTMYKYSKKAQERFFSYPIFAFMFAYFAQNEKGLDFLQKKLLEAKGIDYFNKMKKEIEELKGEALR